MARKIGVSKSEMLRMRAEGMSNRDIAKCLEISYQTVMNYIGPQGGRMERMAAFDEPKPNEVETPKEEPKTAPKAVDKFVTLREAFESADGNFIADLDYEEDVCDLCGLTIPFAELPELVTFIVGLASLAEEKKH